MLRIITQTIWNKMAIMLTIAKIYLRLAAGMFLAMHVGSCFGADGDVPSGFVALCNGKDLTGWKGFVADPPKRAPK